MAFIDQAKVILKGGDGGGGSKSMRREKYAPLGGPDGGDGGRGGSIFFEASNDLRTLVDYAFLGHYEAGNGAKGYYQRSSGKSAKDMVLKVPCGTLVRDFASGEMIADLTEPGQRVLAAKGGRGGRGNIHFVTSTRQAPKLAEKGEPGEERVVKLELKVLADVGLIGFPNAGKSSLLAASSAAHPKIANYPFTTLEPQLGVVRVAGEHSFVMADLPGLIEGAAEGHGLGHRFLKHVERTRVLLTVLDGAGLDGRDPKADYDILRKELGQHHAGLLKLPVVVAVNKMDLPEAREAYPALEKFFKKKKVPVFPISAAARQGVSALLKKTYHLLQSAPPSPLEAEIAAAPKPVLYKPAERFTLRKEGGTFVLEGKEVVKWMAMTDFENDEAVWKLKNILDRLGVNKALLQAGAKEGDRVRVGKDEFYFAP